MQWNPTTVQKVIEVWYVVSLKDFSINTFTYKLAKFYHYLSQLMRLWYSSHRWPAKAQANLYIRPDSPEPSLFAHMKYGNRWRVIPKNTKNQIFSLTGWLHMRIWRMNLWRTKSAKISWGGSFQSQQKQFFSVRVCNFFRRVWRIPNRTIGPD